MFHHDGAAATNEGGRTFAGSGIRLAGPFLSFYEHYGPTLCGEPITDIVVDGGIRRQYFQCLALEEHEPGRVRLLPLGEQYLAARVRADAAPRRRPHIADVAETLRRDPSRHYPTRTLADIRYLVIHHTGAAVAFGPQAIAAEHVDGNGWPGIGYHYVIDGAGTIHRTQDLTVASFHARQFNPVSVGIALLGDLSSSQPAAMQLEALADVVAMLLADLGLPPQSVRGHREMVPTPCPGEMFLRVWKPRLMHIVAERLAPAAAALTHGAGHDQEPSASGGPPEGFAGVAAESRSETVANGATADPAPEAATEGGGIVDRGADATAAEVPDFGPAGESAADGTADSADATADSAGDA